MQKLFINGEILTMRREDDRPEAVLVENGKIRFVGSRGGAEALCRADCETVDLQGRTLLPALFRCIFFTRPAIWASPTQSFWRLQMSMRATGPAGRPFWADGRLNGAGRLY